MENKVKKLSIKISKRKKYNFQSKSTECTLKNEPQILSTPPYISHHINTPPFRGMTST